MEEEMRAREFPGQLAWNTENNGTEKAGLSQTGGDEKWHQGCPMTVAHMPPTDSDSDRHEHSKERKHEDKRTLIAEFHPHVSADRVAPSTDSVCRVLRHFLSLTITQRPSKQGLDDLQIKMTF